MSDSSAPRKAELILEALGANTEFREAVVGDLAEEFALREGWDGRVVARRWYYRECLRVAPYLLRDWWRDLHRGDVGHLANVLGIASVCMVALDPALLIVVRIGTTILGAPHLAPLSLWETPVGSILVPAFMLLWTLGDSAFGGYIAARLGRRAPLPTVLALAAVWATLMLASSLLIGHSASVPGVPLWFRIVNATTMMTGMIAGGVFRTWRASAHGTPALVSDEADIR